MKKWAGLLLLLCSTAFAANEFRAMNFKNTVNFEDTVTLSAGSVFSDDVEIQDAKQLKLDDLDSSAFIGLRAPNVVTSSTTFKLPDGDGTAGQCLATDGAAQLDFVDVGETNTASNLGAGSGLFSTKVGFDLRFKSLTAGSGISLASGASEVTITNTSPGESNTASNLGGGTGIFSAKVGSDLQFKSLVAGSNISFASGSETITISGAAGGVTSIVAGTGINASSPTGTVTVTNTGVTSAVAGTQISLSGSTGAVTINAMAAETDLSNLGAVSINADLDFDNNLTYSIGSTGNSVLNLNTSNIQDTNNGGFAAVFLNAVAGEIKFTSAQDTPINLDGTGSNGLKIENLENPTTAKGAVNRQYLEANAATISLSNIVATAIPDGANLLPLNDSGINLGSGTKQIGTLFVYDISNDQGNLSLFSAGELIVGANSIQPDSAGATTLGTASKYFSDVHAATFIAPTGQNMSFSTALGQQLEFQSHLTSVVFSGPGPTAGACGTGPTLTTSSDTTGGIQVGTGGVDTTCVVNFANAYSAAPRCFVNNKTQVQALSISATTTELTITSLVPLTPADELEYFCIANN